MSMPGQISEECMVYPGKYQPMSFDISEVRFAPKPEEMNRGLSNIIECEGFYKVEIVVPGHTKDDFVLTTDNDLLNVIAIKRKAVTNGEPLYHSHGFNYDIFQYSVTLPAKASTDFVSAEYKAGILTVFLPRSSDEVSNSFHQIIVY